jgi:hypothetical protein
VENAGDRGTLCEENGAAVNQLVCVEPSEPATDGGLISVAVDVLERHLGSLSPTCRSSPAEDRAWVQPADSAGNDREPMAADRNPRGLWRQVIGRQRPKPNRRRRFGGASTVIVAGETGVLSLSR